MEIRERVSDTQGWIMRNRAMLMLIVVVLYALFATKGCINNQQRASELTEAIKDKEAKITYWTDKAGKEHAVAHQVQGSLETVKTIYQGKLDSITKELGIKEKQITEYIEIAKTTAGKFHTKVDTFYTYIKVPVPGDSLNKDSMLVKIQDYLKASYKDKWLTFEGKIKDGNFDAKYSIHDSLRIVGYWKRKGFLHLGRKDYFLDISSENPNTYIDNIKDFKITSDKPRRIGLGFIGGYGIDIGNKFQFRPYIGIGVYYRLL
jgi:hypothetical protein